MLLDKAQAILILQRQLDHPEVRGRRKQVLVSKLLRLGQALAVDVVEAAPAPRPRRLLH